MITDLLAYLRADATLLALLNGDVNNTNIYDVTPLHTETSPYLLVSISSGGTAAEVLDERLIAIRIVAETEEIAAARTISDRLDALLDLQDDLNMSSDNYYVYYGKKVGESDLVEQGRDQVQFLRLFLFKYRAK